MTVLYLANPCGQPVVDAMVAGVIGYIDTPAQCQPRTPGIVWCADNGCFGKGYPGDESYMTWLAGHPDIDACLFATAPDVVGDAAATLVRSAPFLPRIRALGYPAAFVAQNGLEHLEVPWDTFDVLFIGGSTEWKLGPAARDLVRQAKAHGKRVHMGRVNSEKRLRYADHIGCDTADGTFLTFAPLHNLPRLRKWLRGIADQHTLWET